MATHIKVGDVVWMDTKAWFGPHRGDLVEMAYRVAKREAGKLLVYNRAGVISPGWVGTTRELYEKDARVVREGKLPQIEAGEDAPLESLEALTNHRQWGLLEPDAPAVQQLRDEAAKLGFRLERV